jgi:hypothetical protein
MRRICLLVSVLIIAIAMVASASGQTAERAARSRGARAGAKPGEITTPPDVSERWHDQLKVGQLAPEFELPLASGTEDAKAIAQRGKRNTRSNGTATKTTSTQKSISLKELYAKKPVILIFGSVTCPPFRGQLEGIDEVYRDFRDRAEFLFVYIREAHPDSVLSLVDETMAPRLVKVPQQSSLDVRAQAAAACGRTLKLSMPIAVDSMDNTVGRAYAGWPNRMVVVGVDGRILFASSPSPHGVDAARLRSWLEQNLRAAR